MGEAANHARSASTPIQSSMSRSPGLRALQLCTLLISLGLVYGSLLPFDFHRLPPAEAAFGLFDLRWTAPTADDAWTNVLVYIPLGAALAIGLRRRLGRGTAVILSTFIGLVLSLVLESLQTSLRARVGSWTDVALNGLGTSFAALAAVCLGDLIVAALLRMRREWTSRPYRLGASALTLAVLMYGLAPFDFVTSTQELHASFSRANWGFRAVAVQVSPETVAASAAAAGGALWFAVLGYLLTHAAMEAQRHRLLALGSAMKNGFLLAALIEGMQLFTCSHVFDSRIIFLRLIAVALGAWSALFLTEQAQDETSDSPPAIPASLLLFLALVQTALILVPVAVGAGTDWPFHRRADAVVPPLMSLWLLPGPHAMSQALSVVSVYGVLAFTACAAIRRTAPSLSPAWVAGTLTVTVAGTTIVLSAWPTIDLSVMVLAVPAAMLACRMERFLTEARRVPHTARAQRGPR